MLDETTALIDGYTSYYSFSRKRSGYSGWNLLIIMKFRSVAFINYIVYSWIVTNFSKFLGVATYCKNSFTPSKAEEGIAGMYNSHDDRIEFYDQVIAHLQMKSYMD